MEMYVKTKIKIGQGSFAKVYKGYDHDGTPIAVKEYRKNRERNFEYEKRVAEELSAHENIVRILHYDNSYIYMEFCKGESVQRLISRHLEHKAGLDVYSCYKAILDMHAGYFHIRRYGFVHRDIKPDNVMIHFESDGAVLFKIGDWSSTKRDQTKTGSAQKMTSLVGDKAFASPAMFNEMHKAENKGKKKWFFGSGEEGEKYDFSHDMDMWSLGATLIYIICHRKPFRARTDDQLKKLYDGKEPDAIMGEALGDQPEDFRYYTDFTDGCPVSNRASIKLKDAMLKVVRYLMQPVDQQNLEGLRSLVEALKKQGIHYEVNLTSGHGKYTLGEPSTLPWLNLKTIEPFRRALNLATPVGFEFSDDNMYHVSRVYRFRPSCKKEAEHAPKQIVEDLCRLLGELSSRLRSLDLDMQLLKHLVYTNKGTDLPTKLTERIEEVDTIMRKVFTRETEVKVIYQDHFELGKENHVLEYLIKQLQKWENEMKGQVSDYRRLASNAEEGVFVKLCQFIRELAGLGSLPLEQPDNASHDYRENRKTKL